MLFVPDPSIERVRPPLSPRRRRIGWAGVVSVLLHAMLLGGALLLWLRQPHVAALVVPVHPATVQLVMSPPGSNHNAPATLPRAKGPQATPSKPQPPTTEKTVAQKAPQPPKPDKAVEPKPPRPEKTVAQKAPQPSKPDRTAEQQPQSSPTEKTVEKKPPEPLPVQTASAPPQPQPSQVASAPPRPQPSQVASAPLQPERRQTASTPPPPPKLEQAAPKPPPPASATAPMSPQPFQLSLGALESDTNALVTGDMVVPPSPDIKFHNRKPSYPDEAVLHGEQGAVVLLVHVRPDGLVAGVEVARSSGYRTLDDAARETVRTWHFLPSVQDGQPVAADVPIRIVYALDN
ncbi:MAG TPA: TonB family protein [Acetobacteraceae bacterium]|jgi:protein TonB